MNQAYQTALSILSTIREAGFDAYFAGGCVRDRLLGRVAKDFDIATNALPEQIESLFPKTIAVGRAFGVIIVMQDEIQTEVATFRCDGGYQDGRRPQSVRFSSAEEDARRRDFTVNGLFEDPFSGHIIDWVGGRADLEHRVIRTIGAPEERFAEDHLRMLRAVRFATTLGFSIAPATREAIQTRASDLARISAERIEQEVSRILTESPRPGDAVRELVELNVMPYILPEVLPMMGQEQPPAFHPEGDVFEHTVLMLNLMNDPTAERADAQPPHTPEFRRQLAWTLLLHDIGKPSTAQQAADRIRFHGHDRKGADMAEQILRRLKFPVRDIRAICTAIDGHMRFKDVQQMNRSTLRKLIGSDTFDLELELHRLDCLGSHRMLDPYRFLCAERRRMDAEPVLPERWITGKDLLKAGVQPGPDMGDMLRKAYDAQLEGRFETREALLDWIVRHGPAKPHPKSF